ncbi:HlyD family efflux transporter periplasmic adaptor subunit [Candidatus Sumerlaeota bacterium]|nr:HlyD family efflux transporter periplasmic adaptor subunit [Candidatus Sumerlaeota bacterium]
MMANGSKQKIPLRQHVQLLRRRYIPLATWVGAICALILLGKGNLQTIDAVGIVEEKRAPAICLVDGEVSAITVALFDQVVKGQLLGIIDDAAWKAELKTAQEELKRLQAELDAAQEQLQLDRLAAGQQKVLDQRRFQIDEERAHLDVLDRIAQREEDKAELNYLEVILQRQENLQGIQQQTVIDAARAKVKTLQARIEENENAIAMARELWASAKTRRMEAQQVETGETSESPDYPMPSDKTLAPVKQAVAVQDAVISQLMEQREQLLLKAPIEGTVAQIAIQPGETVMRGSALFDVQSSESKFVIAYVDQSAANDVVANMDVMLYTRRRPRQAIPGRVLKVGVQIERFPMRLRPDPDLPRFGLACLIGEYEPGVFIPGEVLDVRFMD